MKRLILASILCASLRAQEKTPAVKPGDPLVAFPQLLAPPGVSRVVQGLDLTHPNQPLVPRAIKLVRGFEAVNSTVCSVPLLEARVDAVDPGIAAKLNDSSVPIPHARVPAPPCKK
jgi:hypothetical protein